MELKRYLKVLLKWWWLILVAFLVVTTATIVFTYTQTPSYEATASLVVSPAAALANLNEVRASLSVLDKPTVINTYAEIAQSQTIVQQAWDDLGISPEVQGRFEVRSWVLQKTNIVLITVAGPDPVIVHEAANAITHHTVDYVSELYEVYNLKLLDAAERPSWPVSPNKKMNLLMGFVLGAGVGVAFTFVAEYLQAPMETVEQLSLIDAQTGAYKRSYFLRRLREEISRSSRHERPFAISRVRVDSLDEIAELYSPRTREVALQQVVRFLRQSLPEEDVVAHWSDGDLVILLPDRDESMAQQAMERLQTKMLWTPFEIEGLGKFNLTASFGVATYAFNGVGPDDLLKKATEALHQAELGGNGNGGIHHPSDEADD